MTDVINQRLAARLEQLAIERILRAETVADRIGQTIDYTLIRATYPDQSAADIAHQLDVLPAALVDQMDDMMTRLASWTHTETVRIIADVMPRKWLRSIQPTAVLVGEHTSSIGIRGSRRTDWPFADIWPGLTGDGRRLFVREGDDSDQDAPVIRRRMTDAEWAEWVGQQIFPPLSHDEVSGIVHADVNGITWQQRIEGLSNRINPVQAAAVIVDGYAQGLDADTIVDQLLPHITGRVKADARRIARTECLRVSNAVQLATFSKSQHLLSGIQIMTRLDERTRHAHAVRHGATYYYDQTSALSVARMPVLPDAPNCRCYYVPILKPPEQIETDAALVAEFRDQQGKLIPDPAEYSQWYLRADEGKRKMAVGAGRYNVLKSKFQREPAWSDFLDGTGNLVSIDTLRKETEQQYHKRKRSVLMLLDARRNLILQTISTGYHDPFQARLRQFKQNTSFASPEAESDHPTTSQRVQHYRQVMDANSRNAQELRKSMLAKARLPLSERDFDSKRIQRLVDALRAIRETLPEATSVEQSLRLMKKQSRFRQALDPHMYKLNRFKSRQRRRAFAVIQVTDPVEFRGHVSAELSEANQSKIDAVNRFMGQVTSRRHSRNGVFGDGRGAIDIAYHSTTNKRATLNLDTRRISVPMKISASRIAHEVGHALEEFGEVHELAKGFLHSRVGKEAVKSLSAEFPDKKYKDYELGREDDFASAFQQKIPALTEERIYERALYTGKYYQGATEVLSVGVELLYDDPVRFAERDPEWFDFVVGILRGDLLP
jgi:SPP1 gp7 family putative phage head morphogenesis protein